MSETPIYRTHSPPRGRHHRWRPPIVFGLLGGFVALVVLGARLGGGLSGSSGEPATPQPVPTERGSDRDRPIDIVAPDLRSVGRSGSDGTASTPAEFGRPPFRAWLVSEDGRVFVLPLATPTDATR
jgi:hypothetical protein